MGKGPKKTEHGMKEIFCRYVVRNGKRIYPKNAKFFHFFIEIKKS